MQSREDFQKKLKKAVESQKWTVKFVGKLTFSDSVVVFFPAAHSLKFPMNGLKNNNKKTKGISVVMWLNLIEFNKETNQNGEVFPTVLFFFFFLPKFFPSVSEPTLTFTRNAKPRPIPNLPKVLWLKNISNIHAHSGYLEVLEIENNGGSWYVRVSLQSSARV